VLRDEWTEDEDIRFVVYGPVCLNILDVRRSTIHDFLRKGSVRVAEGEPRGGKDSVLTDMSSQTLGRYYANTVLASGYSAVSVPAAAVLVALSCCYDLCGRAR
jgi:hypothetical protein